MNKYIVLGVNDNPKYLYYLPLVIRTWGEFGWWPIIFYSGPDTKVSNFVFDELEGFVHYPPTISDFKSETLAQVSRLYGCCVEDGMMMTSDIDMLPLSNYWNPDWDKITTYGRDLTDYHYPICYIAMHSSFWVRIMKAYTSSFDNLLIRDLRHQKNMWVLDQDIITERLLSYGKDKITHIDRGTDKRTGYPIGRVDRSNWHLNHSQLIDAHLPHDILTNDESYKKVVDLLHHVWPNDFSWFQKYHIEFKKLL